MPTSPRLLVVDDEPDLCTLYELCLLREGYAVVCARDLAQARNLLAQQCFDVLITDMRLPDGLGLALLDELNQAQRAEKSIVITAYGSAENAVQSLKLGAFDYLTKPVDLKQLRATVAAALQSRPRQTACEPGQSALRSSRSQDAARGAAQSALERLVGSAPSVLQIKNRIIKVAASMAPVLIVGESGTGKELVARAVHACSHRASGALVAVNCGAIPEHLIEAEFFGVRKGAYTGATQNRNGYFQAAQGGSLLLDEIGDLPLPMQAKLLRVIQERRVRPLGSTQEEALDVRLMSATHRDLAAMVQRGEFRQDLFYRLNVIELRTPALRERREDLPALARALLQRLCAESGQHAPELAAQALAWLAARELPGNVRELENLLQRALALSDGRTLDLADFDDAAPVSAGAASPASAPAHSDVGVPSDLQAYLDEQERQVLQKALQEADFNRTAAAARLGLNLRQMRYRIQRLGIVVPAQASSEDEHGV